MDKHTAAVTVPERLSGQRFDVALADLAGLSRSQARRLIDGGQAMVPKNLGASGRVETGMVISYAPPQAQTIKPVLAKLDLLYEDDHLVVINKPAGLVVHPAPGHYQNTLVSVLLYRWPQIEGVGEYPRWGIVHRLDKDTSGAMVVAKTNQAHLELSKALAQRAVQRTYLALVIGLFSLPTGTIDCPIIGEGGRRKVSTDGKPAVTHYKCLAEWLGQGLSLLELNLGTGRTHQIRVHMQSIDRFIVGDPVYGRPGPPQVDPGRVWLHSRRIGFTHPVTGVPIVKHASLPPDLVASLNALGTPDKGTMAASGVLAKIDQLPPTA